MMGLIIYCVTFLNEDVCVMRVEHESSMPAEIVLEKKEECERSEAVQNDWENRILGFAVLGTVTGTDVGLSRMSQLYFYSNESCAK